MNEGCCTDSRLQDLVEAGCLAMKYLTSKLEGKKTPWSDTKTPQEIWLEAQSVKHRQRHHRTPVGTV